MKTLQSKVRILNTALAGPMPKRAQSIYSTPEFKRWRKAVIDRSGGVCQGPNCGRTGARLFADHIRELRDGGAPYDVANGQALCGSCHTAKTARAREARQRR